MFTAGPQEPIARLSGWCCSLGMSVLSSLCRSSCAGWVLHESGHISSWHCAAPGSERCQSAFRLVACQRELLYLCVCSSDIPGVKFLQCIQRGCLHHSTSSGLRYREEMECIGREVSGGQRSSSRLVLTSAFPLSAVVAVSLSKLISPSGAPVKTSRTLLLVVVLLRDESISSPSEFLTCPSCRLNASLGEPGTRACSMDKRSVRAIAVGQHSEFGHTKQTYRMR